MKLVIWFILSFIIVFFLYMGLCLNHLSELLHSDFAMYEKALDETERCAIVVSLIASIGIVLKIRFKDMKTETN